MILQGLQGRAQRIGRAGDTARPVSKSPPQGSSTHLEMVVSAHKQSPPVNPHTNASASGAGSSLADLAHQLNVLRAARQRLPHATERLVPISAPRWMPWPVSGLIRWCMSSRRIAPHELAAAVGCEEIEILRLQAVGMGSPCVLVAALTVIHRDEPLQMHDVLAICSAIKIDDTLPLVFTGQPHELVGAVLARMRADVLCPVAAAKTEAPTPNYDGRGRAVPLESPYVQTTLGRKGVVA